MSQASEQNSKASQAASAAAAAASSVEEDNFTARATVVKNSWKGHYTRIFAIGARRVATINARTILRITNSWDYDGGLVDVLPEARSTTQFSVAFRRTGKPDTMSFDTLTESERADLLTEVQRHRPRFDPAYAKTEPQRRFVAKKLRSNAQYEARLLVVTSYGIVQLDYTQQSELGEYLYMHIKGITTLVDQPGNSVVIAYGPQMKLHLYQLDDAERFCRLVREYSARFIGLPPYRAMNALLPSQFESDRLGVRRDVLEAVAEFAVQKLAPRHGGRPVGRLLSTAAVTLVERDPATYSPVCVYLLSSVFYVVRDVVDEQRFSIVFREPYRVKHYTAPLRDALLAHVVDACRAAGNMNVCVCSELLARGRRACPAWVTASEEVESTLLNCLVNPQRAEASATPLDLVAVAGYFNANVNYNGLRSSENKDGIFVENREKLIYQALHALLHRYPETSDTTALVRQFQALRRLTVSRTGFSSIAVVPALVRAVGVCAVRGLRRNDAAVSHAVIDFLNTLMTPHHNHYELAHESINKNRLLDASSFVLSLLTTLRDCIYRDGAALVVQSLLDFFVYALCPPYSETTDAALFRRVLQELLDTVGKRLFHLLRHPCLAIRYAAGQLVRVGLEEGDATQFAFLQHAALTEAGILVAFHAAVFGSHRALRDLARRLLAYWAYDNTAVQDLLRRMLPLTMLNFLQSSEQAPEEEQEEARGKGVTQMTMAYRESKQGWFKKSFRPRQAAHTAGGGGVENKSQAAVGGAGGGAEAAEAPPGQPRTRVREVRVKPTLNWPLLFYQIKRDHQRPDLIWNHVTRDELRRAIEVELESFDKGVELGAARPIAWNYYEFEVVYHSLDDELKVGQHYPRLLFESSAAAPVVARPAEFFRDLYHRFLLVTEPRSRLECLHGMTLLYDHYAEDIGQFNDLVAMLRALQATTDPAMRDRLLLFLAAVLKARYNVKLFLDADGPRVLAELVTLAQLHVDRPQMQVITNAIEYAGRMGDLQGQSKEWYVKPDEAVSYTALKEMYKTGAVTATTRVWADGMSGWREIASVPQLKWGIVCADAPALLSLTEVTCTVLDVFLLLCAHYPSQDDDGALVQPLPRIKRYLSGSQVLPHLVQLLLTFDSAVCCRVHRLLYALMEDNPLVSRFYLTGVFFFALMYTASDVLPLCRLLYLTHQQQSGQFAQGSSNAVVRHSVLAPLLPPAMICYLVHHGPDAFANILLGEYETPETIWGAAMRRYLAGKIAAHVADFTPRLLGNNTLVYQYCPIGEVHYEELQREMFCSEYYLRHLCDELHFPQWPLRDPVALLRDVLATWRQELTQPPSTLSRRSCLRELELLPADAADGQESADGDAVYSEASVRRAYFALAARFHPDKNPDGRERFERVQAAYAFLVSDAAASTGPDRHHIALLLQTQSILYRRCADVLRQYKYAGYELLLQLIQRELDDVDMLHHTIVLMVPATELCFHTVHNVPLNADELQEEGGVALLTAVLARCFDLITPHAKDDEAHVRIATQCMRTFAVAARLSDFRGKMEAEAALPYLTAKGIACDAAAPELSRACVEACTSQCASAVLQERLITCGAVWHLLRLLFRYDPTLADADVALSEAHHGQLFANHAARLALRALCALAGITAGDAQHGTAAPASAAATTVRSLLQRLLTPFVMRQVDEGLTAAGDGGDAAEDGVLRLLNTNSATPYLVWDNSTRAELEELLANNSARCRAARLGATAEELPSLHCDGFVYSAHKDEVVIGGVFVRLYIAQPGFVIEQPAKLFEALAEYLCTAASRDDGSAAPQVLVDRRLAITALRTLVANTPAAEERLAGVAAAYLLNGSLVRLLALPDSVAVFETLQLLDRLLNMAGCLEAFARSAETMARLLLALRDHAGDATTLAAVLIVLRTGLASRVFVEQGLQHGLHVFLLDLYATAPTPALQEESCVCLGRAFSDRLVGPQMLLRCARLLPEVMLDAMKESPALACQMLDSWQRNPELVWSKGQKSRLVAVVRRCRDECAARLRDDPQACWTAADEQVCLAGAPRSTADEAEQELQVGGVYLGLYLQHPGWAVRRPKEFLVALLDRFVAASDGDDDTVLAQLVDSGTRLLTTSTPLRDYCASLGYAGKLLGMLDCPRTAVAHGALRWLRELCLSRAWVAAMLACDAVAPLMSLQERAPAELPLVMDTLERLVTQCGPATVTQPVQAQGGLGNVVLRYAMQHNLPARLLQLLDDGVPVAARAQLAPAAVRALVIKVLKALISVADTQYGPALAEQLAGSGVWQKYKDQSHDMFLENTPFAAGYLTAGGGAGGTQALLLSLNTDPQPSQTSDHEPPPLPSR